MTDFDTLDEDEISLSIPKGGPIYIRDMVGPLTMISSFEASGINELENLRSEVCLDLFDVPDEELCVDELKIIAEDELVNKAFEEAFENVEETGGPSNASEAPADARRDQIRLSSSEQACSEGSGITQDASVPQEALNDALVRADDNKEVNNVSKKRKRRGRKVDVQNQQAEKERYFAKVKRLADIKKKQDDDKAAACLHSFKGVLGINEKVKVPNGAEKMETLRSTNSGVKVKQSNLHEYVPVHHPECVLSVEVYHKKQPSLKTQELLVLGCQPLSDLKDSICCSTDDLMTKAGHYDPSGYFLIEDVFYNDLRDPSAIDYSEPILNWLRNSKDEAREKWRSIISGNMQPSQNARAVSNSQLPSFRAAEMHKVQFRDLQFRLGAGYTYCHQGDCKHGIVIRDMRLIHPEDVQNQTAYPIPIFQLKKRFQKCSVCNIYRAEKVTVDDKWAKENPCYFCKNCYYMLHYEGGSLLYDEFSVYDYHLNY